jgi:Spy/CpxP family protein refolding chaperone
MLGPKYIPNFLHISTTFSGYSSFNLKSLTKKRRVRMKRMTILCSMLALTITASSWPVRAETEQFPARFEKNGSPHDKYGPNGELQGERELAALTRILRLNETQQAKIKKLLKADQGVMESLLMQLADTRKLLRLKAEAVDFNKEEIIALAEKEGRLMARMFVAPALIRQDIRALLTPEQRDLEERIFPLLAPGPGSPPKMEGGCAMMRRERFRPSEGDFPPPQQEEIPPPCCFDD